MNFTFTKEWLVNVSDNMRAKLFEYNLFQSNEKFRNGA